jgi:hypothetical protein
MKLISVTAFLSFALVSSSVFAQCSQSNNEISLMGVESSKVIYAELGSHSNECSCNHARFNVDDVDTDKVLSLLMSAKLSGNRVRIDFLDVQSCDGAVSVYLQ